MAFAATTKLSTGNTPTSPTANTTGAEDALLEAVAAVASKAAVFTLKPVVAGTVTPSPTFAFTHVFFKTKLLAKTVGVSEHAEAVKSEAPAILNVAALNKPWPALLVQTLLLTFDPAGTVNRTVTS